jgi:hypothetical protein
MRAVNEMRDGGVSIKCDQSEEKTAIGLPKLLLGLAPDHGFQENDIRFGKSIMVMMHKRECGPEEFRIPI